VITPLKCERERGRLRLAVKDNIDVAGVVTTAGSHYLATHNPPAEKDAPCLEIARERNAQIVAKTNLSEFAISPSGINDYYGTPRNPFCFWRRRIPGGSSSGSAVAVAGGIADVAFGNRHGWFDSRAGCLLWRCRIEDDPRVGAHRWCGAH
jgi:amidase